MAQVASTTGITSKSRIMLAKGRASFVNLFEPKVSNKKEVEKYGAKPEYSWELAYLIPKTFIDANGVQQTTDISGMNKLIQAVIDDKWKGEIPENYSGPIRDGDTDPVYCNGTRMPNGAFVPDGTMKPLYASYKNCWVLQLKSKNSEVKPAKVVGVKPDGSPQFKICEGTDAGPDFYAGVWCQARVTAYGYTYEGKSGVRFGLQNIFKIHDGEPLGVGKVAPEDDYEGINLDEWKANNQQLITDQQADDEYGV